MRGLAALTLLAFVGCAKITTTHHVEIVPKAGKHPVVLGPPHGEVARLGLEAAWQQAADTLEVDLVETRWCAVVRHEPVVRIDRIERTTGGALYWEYGLAGVSLGLGLTALIRPDLFSQSSVDSDGETVKDLRAGYRIGGIFTAIGTAFLAAGIYDTVRGRDETVYVEAYRVHRGEDTTCAQPRLAVADQTVELIVGPWHGEGITDDDGHVRFELPDADALGEMPSRAATAPDEAEPPTEPVAPPASPESPPASAPATTPGPEVPPEPEPEPAPVLAPSRMVTAVLRLDRGRAMAFDLVVPYDHPEAAGREGVVAIDPIRVRTTASPKQPPAPAAGSDG